MSFCLLLFDLDGTLLGPDRRIRPATCDVLRDLMTAGVGVGFATGRSHVSIAEYVAALAPNGPCVLFNGAMVWDPVAPRIVSERHLRGDVTQGALGLAADLGVHVNLYVGDEIIIRERTPTSEESQRKDGVVHRVVGDLARFFAGQERAATKLLLIAEDGDFTEYERRLQLAPRDATLVHSEPTYLEILPAGTSKGEGLATIASLMGIPASDVIAFGDELNDIEILAGAGLGVAMGNGQAALKEIADVVIGANDSDAIAEFLRREMRVVGGRLESRA